MSNISGAEAKILPNTVRVFFIGTGFYLGIITLMDEGMELSLGYHAANNLVSVLLVTSDWQVFQTNYTRVLELNDSVRVPYHSA